eukprot:CAMPEP_0168542338 /NCGR_PEP_ID=MMETSP0413-20121227/1293_1 /TAXON_ID=136452 /ORGANISM="Filamoeba nolandi, Strain NC-AS-23-1" /LENGTH=99 /DNA_ID=CAMNT_0008572205 /DNA_START=125 /DNA_END=424 /DNA_ORIENTATION=-
MDGQTMILLKDSFYKQKKYQTGDIVFAKNPFQAKGYMVKRVFATEGEIFLKAPSPQDANQDLYELVQVPKGHIWVEGQRCLWILEPLELSPSTWCKELQ